MVSIIKNEIGNILILESGVLEHIIATDVFVQKHPVYKTAVMISKTPTRQDVKEAIVLYAEEVSSVDGKAFAGDVNALMLALSTVFKSGRGADGGSGSDVNISDYIPKSYAQTDDVSRTFNTAWSDGFETTRFDIRKGWDIEFYYEIPCRNTSSGYGGGYTEVLYSLDGVNYTSLGNSGYQLVMASGGGNISTESRLLLISRSLINAPDENIKISFKMRHKSYEGSLWVNRGRGTTDVLFASVFTVKESKHIIL